MTDTQLHFDVAVVGAGLVGSSAACALGAIDPSLNIVLIDPTTVPPLLETLKVDSPGVGDFDPRVVALTRHSQVLLEDLGAWQLLANARRCAYTDMQVWDADGTAKISFDCSEIQQDNLGHIVENRLIVSALGQCLQAAPNVTTLFGEKVSDCIKTEQHSELVLDGGSIITASLVLACDGANSPLRQLHDISSREWDYGHSAIVSTIKTQQPHDGVARQRFMKTGPLAFLPLASSRKTDGSEEHFCSIVWSCEHDLAKQMMSLEDADFCSELAAALEYEVGDVVEVAKRFCIPLRQRHASTYIKPGLALAGDAAHTIHPLAGQGVNLGLQDVAAFVTEVEYAHRRGVALQDYSILRRYQRARKTSNLSMMATMEGFKRLFGAENIAARWLRNEGMRQVDKLPLLKNKIIREAMGL